jgi:RimJ/RimL family protein N-acetyltransferase
MLVGEKIRLRAFDRRDIPFAVEVLNDPGVRAQIMSWQPLSVAREEQIFESLTTSKTDLTFVVEDRAGPHRSIGLCGLHDVDWKNGNACVGICLQQGDWSKGYGTDALRSLVTFAFDEMGLHRVELDVLQSNVRGIKSYEKVGFQPEGIKRHAMFRDGAYRDVLLMSILPGELERRGNT